MRACVRVCVCACAGDKALVKTLAKVAAVPAQDVIIDQVDCDASAPRRVHVWVSVEVSCSPMRAARIIVIGWRAFDDAGSHI